MPLPLWRLAAFYFFYFGFIGSFSPYFTLYLESLGLSAPRIAVLMSLMQLMRIVAPNLWGWLADRSGERLRIIRISAVVSLIGFSGFFFTTEYAGMFLAMAVMAFFWSATLPLVESLTFAHLEGQVGRYGSIRSWGSVGFIVAVLGIGYLLDMIAQAAVLWVNAAVLAGIVACAALIPEKVSAAQDEAGGRLWEILRQRRVQVLLAACFLMSAAHGALYVFYSIHLVAAGYDKALVGWMWTLGVVAEIGVFMLMPRIVPRVSLRTVLLWAFSAAVLRFLLIGWGISNFGVVVFAQLLHGLTFGAYHAAAIAAINQWFPGRQQARGQALYGSLSFGAGGMLGGMVSGYTWNGLGAGVSFSIGSLFALAGLMLLWRGWREPGVV